MDKIVEHVWLQLGAVGLLVIFLVTGIWYLARHVKYLMKEHKHERDEWRGEAQGQTQKMMNVVEQNSTAVSKLCTMIESRSP
uniref:Uncharacterized protein n=1 Tax=viral metagenome TaxID=1070528 RepID=A0A6M3J1B4_9ZZZZ